MSGPGSTLRYALSMRHMDDFLLGYQAGHHASQRGEWRSRTSERIYDKMPSVAATCARFCVQSAKLERIALAIRARRQGFPRAKRTR